MQSLRLLDSEGLENHLLHPPSPPTWIPHGKSWVFQQRSSSQLRKRAPQFSLLEVKFLWGKAPELQQAAQHPERAVKLAKLACPFLLHTGCDVEGRVKRLSFYFGENRHLGVEFGTAVLVWLDNKKQNWRVAECFPTDFWLLIMLKPFCWWFYKAKIDENAF